MEFDPADIRTLIHVATKRTGTPVHDEDLEQDVALQALEAFRRIDQVTHPRALLMKIVRDAVRDHWRRRRSSEDLECIDERLLSHAPEFETELDQKRDLALIRSAVESLPAPKRTILELYYIQGHSIPRIAQLQSRTVSAVKMELARTRQSLARIVRGLANKKSR
jgi:RNA polymerase sigma factor (sigma-70 family)